MDEKNESMPSKRALKIGLIALAAVLAVVVGSYCALCAWVNSSDQVLPHTTAAGVDVGGLKQSAAETAIQTAAQSRRAGTTLTVGVTVDGQTETVLTVNGEDTLTVDAAATARAAWQQGREQGFLLCGWNWLQAMLGGQTVDAQFTDQGGAELHSRLEQYARQFNQQHAMEQPAWAMEEGAALLKISLGSDGLELDAQAAYDQVAQALAQDQSGELSLAVEEIPAPEPDLEDIYRQVYVEPADAVFDTKTYEITPHVTGVSFDIAQVRAGLEAAAAAGERTVTVEPTLTEPEVTTQKLEATLFRDVLGSCTTSVSGSSNRLSNVKLAASMCNGTILLPGEEFSYNDATGPRTLEKGFLPAPSYVGGDTVDSVGGGICQVSSTIYLAALRSNLEIVRRQNHSFAVGYIPDGMDATVYYGSIEFIFRNNTDQPIKLQARVDGRKLTVSILGTNDEGIYTEITNRYLSTNPYETIYEESPDLKPGESVVKVTGYNGKVVETYRNVYDKDGNLLSSTLEAKSTYKRRDKIVLVGPEETATVNPEPSPSPEPSTSPEPSASPEPSPSSEPSVSPSPSASPEPSADVQPASGGEQAA